MLIPKDKISEILNASDIIDVISDAVTLKKSGRNYFGLCPFHSEKTPSFSVSPDKQIFYCFGCSAGGNVFSFIMKYHGLSFPEAANMLARKSGIVLESVALKPQEKKKFLLKEGLFRVNQRVRDFFTEQLKDSGKAVDARNYLEKRGLTSETLDVFSIGYAPDTWDSVVLMLKKMKISRSMAEASGLVLERKSGSNYYDRFRNRIIFPILDVNMQVAGFGGRVMDDAMPKYLNSPETPVYSKGKVLYGLHAAKQYCRQQESVYIVEGYFDFLSLFQSGIKNCVATLGTALTVEHVRLLKGYASQMILVFDSDDAGINAAGRSVDMFMKQGVAVRILILPQGQDPDSFVSKHGRDAFESAAQNAMSVMEFLTQSAVNKHGLSIEGKLAVLEEMSRHLASVHESVARSLYIRDLSHMLGIDEKAILEKVRLLISSSYPRKHGGRHGFSGIGKGGAGYENPVCNGGKGRDLEYGDGRYRQRQESCKGDDEGLQPETRKGSSAAWEGRHDGYGECESPGAAASGRRETQIISMMLQFPDIIDEIKKRNVLDCFYSSRLKALGCLVMTVAASGQPERLAADVMAALTKEEDREFIASLAMMEMSEVDDVLEKSVFLMNRVIHVRQKNENSLSNEIRKIEQSSDTDLPLDLLRQRQRQIRKLRGYK